MKTRQEQEYGQVPCAEEGAVKGRVVSNVLAALSGAEAQAVRGMWALRKEAGGRCEAGLEGEASRPKKGRTRGGRVRAWTGECETKGAGKCVGLGSFEEESGGVAATSSGVSGEEPLCEVPTEHPARMLACRVDALYLAFSGKLLPEVRAELVSRTMDAHEVHTGVAFHWKDFAGVINAHSREGWWRLELWEGEVLINEKGKGGWTVEIKPRAMFLHTESPKAAIDWASGVVRTLFGEMKGIRLRRIDLCADFVHFGLAGINIQAFHGKKTKVTSIATVREFAKEGIRTGFMIGSGAITAGIYDKTEELRLPRNDGGDKRSLEEATWRLAGWNGVDPVTRVEFRFRGKAIKEFQILDPEEALRKLDGLWAYGAKKWLRLVVLGTATRRERCRLDPLWARVQNVVFRERQAPLVRERDVGQTDAIRALRTMFNAAASDGALRPIPCRTGREYAERMSEERAEAWVQTEFRFHCGAHHGARFAAKVLSRCAPYQAAALIVEIRNTVCVRRRVKAIEPEAMAA